MDEYHNGPTIPDDAVLWRRIPVEWCVLDEDLGVRRPSSQAFQDDPQGGPMSVLLAAVMQETGRGAEHALAGNEAFALAAITAGLARKCDQAVARDPVPDEPAHAVVVGRKTNSVRRKMARAAAWIVPPPGQSTYE